jgi:hypothetical protein
MISLMPSEEIFQLQCFRILYTLQVGQPVLYTNVYSTGCCLLCEIAIRLLILKNNKFEMKRVTFVREMAYHLHITKQYQQ